MKERTLIDDYAFTVDDTLDVDGMAIHAVTLAQESLDASECNYCGRNTPGITPGCPGPGCLDD